MAQKHNAWLSGIMGVVVGDALGCPVQFETRNEVARHPVTGMRGNGTFRLPAGSWTDDSSMTLALAESIRRTSTIDYTDIMENFVKWYSGGEFTPFGYAYDIGITTGEAIRDYIRNKDPFTCGRNGVYNCGNGSLMRILPACLYCIEQDLSNEDAIEIIHKVGSLTHAYIRANIACGLYYFMIKEIQTTDSSRSLPELLQEGLTKGFDFYETWFINLDNYEISSKNLAELNHYDRLRELNIFAEVPAEEIKSNGYVVSTLEAAVWSLITTSSFEEALLKAVNLGKDTDTVGAVAGGLGGLYYGYSGIPEAWLEAIQKREWVESICR